MGLTTSYVWQGRRQSEVSAMIRHEARSVEEQQGVKRRHANPLIDAARTGENRVLVNDGQGGFKLADSVDEISEAFERRLAQRKAGKGRSSPRKIRSDSNTAALFVLQLDPEFTGPCEGMSPEKRAEVERLHQVMIDQVVERMGQQNVISVSHHWDETNPHVHIICTAMTPDDRVAYYQAVGNDGKRSDWAAHHDAMREALRDSGYDATFERVGQGRKGESLTMYKQQMDQQHAAADELGSEWVRLDQWDTRLDNRDKRFDAWRGEKEQEFKARNASLNQEVAKLDQAWEALDERERVIVDAEAMLERDREDARERKSQAARELAEATQKREAAQQAADTAVDEAVAAWQRDELPKMKAAAKVDAEAEAKDAASSITHDAETKAAEMIEDAEAQARLRAVQEGERLKREAEDEAKAKLEEAQEQAAEVVANAEKRAKAKLEAAEDERKSAQAQGWNAGFAEAKKAVDAICEDFRVSLNKDRLDVRYRSVNEAIATRQAQGPGPLTPEDEDERDKGGGSGSGSGSGDYGE